MAHHTKDKGDLGVLKAQADLFAQGFHVLLPLTEHAPFDLVAYKDGRFWRVQVKYRTPKPSGVMTIDFRSCWNDRHGTHMRPMNKQEVDLVCVYCPADDRCYYFNPRRFRNSVWLRLSPARNGNRKNIHMAIDFRLVPTDDE
jgi:hypothetical protein